MLLEIESSMTLSAHLHISPLLTHTQCSMPPVVENTTPSHYLDPLPLSHPLRARLCHAAAPITHMSTLHIITLLLRASSSSTTTCSLSSSFPSEVSNENATFLKLPYQLLLLAWHCDVIMRAAVLPQTFPGQTLVVGGGVSPPPCDIWHRGCRSARLPDRST